MTPHEHRRVAIVGGGYAGLLTALLLLEDGHRVTVVSAQRPEEVRDGRITSTQCVFGARRRPELAAGLAEWNDVAPPITQGQISFWVDSTCVVGWDGDLLDVAQSVDHRIKLARWLELVAERGGTVEHRTVDLDDVDDLAASHDLVLAATGRGGFAGLFPRDEQRSFTDRPLRHLAVCYLAADPGPAIRWSIVPGVGEVLVIPCLTHTGACSALLFEAVPGGPFDDLGPRSGTALWQRIRALLREHVPHEHARLADAPLTDELATLSGAITPTVRHPVGVLPSGRTVLGIADAVVVNDPLTAPGANLAALAAALHTTAITDHTGEFDPEWMRATHEAWWEVAGGARDVTRVSAAFLQPTPQLQSTVLAAGEDRALQRRLARVLETGTDPDGLLAA